MLQPKRTKFRKQFKGRNRGLAQRGNSVAFGDYRLEGASIAASSRRGRSKRRAAR